MDNEKERHLQEKAMIIDVKVKGNDNDQRQMITIWQEDESGEWCKCIIVDDRASIRVLAKRLMDIVGNDDA